MKLPAKEQYAGETRRGTGFPGRRLQPRGGFILSPVRRTAFVAVAVNHYRYALALVGGTGLEPVTSTV